MTDDEFFDAFSDLASKLYALEAEAERRMEETDRANEWFTEIHTAWYGEPPTEGHTVNAGILSHVLKRDLPKLRANALLEREELAEADVWCPKTGQHHEWRPPSTTGDVMCRHCRFMKP